MLELQSISGSTSIESIQSIGTHGGRAAPLVMGDHDHLEILLRLAVVHEAAQRLRQACGIGAIEVSGGLIERKDAAVEAECLCQCQPDDEARQHLQYSHQRL